VVQRFNRSPSGWFDSMCFDDWVQIFHVHNCNKLGTGKKILIGDNLSSHLSTESIKICHENNIQFVFLPTYSTHLTQPLDVAFFRPLKIHWRKILEDWKMGEGKEDTSIPKDKFPRLLKKLCLKINENGCENVMAGFKKCGIVPLNRDQVLDMLPDSRNYSENSTADTSSQSAIDESLKKFLELMRPSDQKQQRRKRTKLNVEPGMSVETITSENEDDPELVKEVEDMEEDKEKSFSDTNSSISEVASVEKPAFVKMHGKIFQNVYYDGKYA